jgi:hypothetical protein
MTLSRMLCYFVEIFKIGGFHNQNAPLPSTTPNQKTNQAKRQSAKNQDLTFLSVSQKNVFPTLFLDFPIKTRVGIFFK